MHKTHVMMCYVIIMWWFVSSLFTNSVHWTPIVPQFTTGPAYY